MKFLSDYVDSRDNNFNLLRFIAASMVLWGHSWAITSAGNDPLAAWFEVPAPHMAVDIFFAISGFLVTGSLLSRKNLLAFSFARIFRLVPGLFISTLITVFTIGLYFTTLPTNEYLQNPSTYQYIWINSTLLETQISIPGVFDAVGGTVNGSLWTLPYEFKMYAILACIGLLIYVWPRLLPEFFAAIAVLSIALLASIGLMLVAYGPAPLAETLLENAILSDWRFFSMFFLGGSFFILRRFIPLNIFILGAIAIAVYVSKKIYFTDTGNNCLFFGVYSLFLPYVVLYFAYLPSRLLNKFNELGDYSYGIYMYAFPIQQSVLALGLASTPWGLTGWAFPATLLMAIFSWHMVEKPSMQLKNIYRSIQIWLSRMLPFTQRLN